MDLAVMHAGEKLPADKMQRLLGDAYVSCAPMLQHMFGLARGGKEVALKKEAARIFAAPPNESHAPPRCDQWLWRFFIGKPAQF